MHSPQILSQSERWIVASKPAGWLTIPGRGLPDAPILRDWLESAEGVGQKVFVVHRIDRETSGVVLFARTPDAHREASRWFEKHQIKKAYDCLAAGAPALPVMRVQKEIEGARSLSQVEVKEKFPGAFLARVVPLTGRRHQIRIHLAGEGYPLLGDPRYGGPQELGFSDGDSLSIERVALHARRLELPGGEVFEAEWPEDFASWVEALRLKKAGEEKTRGEKK